MMPSSPTVGPVGQDMVGLDPPGVEAAAGMKKKERSSWTEITWLDTLFLSAVVCSTSLFDSCLR